jgi:hypothetical protein
MIYIDSNSHYANPIEIITSIIIVFIFIISLLKILIGFLYLLLHKTSSNSMFKNGIIGIIAVIIFWFIWKFVLDIFHPPSIFQLN